MVGVTKIAQFKLAHRSARGDRDHGIGRAHHTQLFYLDAAHGLVDMSNSDLVFVLRSRVRNLTKAPLADVTRFVLPTQ